MTSICSASIERHLLSGCSRPDRLGATGPRAVMAESSIVLEGAQILAGRCHHGLWFDAESRKAVLGADAVDRQRAIIVAGEGAARHEVHDQGLHSRGEIR